MLKQLTRLTPEEYLEFESRSAVKHDFLDGEIFAMAGASRRHNMLVGNLMRWALNATVAGGQCQVFGSDMRVRVEARNCFYYPDLSVCCDPDDREPLYLSRPCLIVEVISPSSIGYDRREKRVHYATIPSLQEYVIVDQDRMRVRMFPREGGPWMVHTLDEPNDLVHLSCLGLTLSLDEIYEGVELGLAEPEPAPYAAGW